MSPLLRDDDLIRIDLPSPGEWVDCKARLSRGDEIAVQRAVVSGAHVTAGTLESIDAGTALEAAEFATLERAIKAWSFDVPVTPDAIRSLDGDSIDAIKLRLNELYPGARTEADSGNSSGDGARPALTAVPSPQSSAG